MNFSSSQFAKLVYDALLRVEPSYVRRTGGISKGGGAHADVVQFSTQAEASAVNVIWAVPDLTYLSAGDDQGAFLVNRTGIYAVSFSGTQEPSAPHEEEIRVGAAVDNNGSDANTRARANMTITPDLQTAWTGFVPAGSFIWCRNTGTPSANVNENQVSIVRVR